MRATVNATLRDLEREGAIFPRGRVEVVDIELLAERARLVGKMAGARSASLAEAAGRSGSVAAVTSGASWP